MVSKVEEIINLINSKKGEKVSVLSEVVKGTDKEVLKFHCTVHGTFSKTVRGIKTSERVCKLCSYDKASHLKKGIRCIAVGEEHLCNMGSTLTVIDLLPNNSDQKVKVRYKGEFTLEVNYTALRKGAIKNLWLPYIKGVGFIGKGAYTSLDEVAYNKWSKMIQRCYAEDYSKMPTYEGCTVSEEWHNFQNYAAWYYSTLIESPLFFHVDKDILVSGNKHYSKETCAIVPRELNMLLTLRGNDRGAYPLGIYFKTKNNKFCVQCKDPLNIAQTYLGLYDTIEDAAEVYIEFKNRMIKESANRYKDVITADCYNALMSFDIRRDVVGLIKENEDEQL